LRDIYQGLNLVVDNIRGGYAIANPVGFGVEPEKTTQYEIGFKQQLGNNFAFDITGFYKNIKDQVQIRSIFADPDANHVQYYAFVNGDFSTTKGVEFKLDLRRTNRLSAQVNYTFSDAQGTGSVPNSAFRAIWQSPTEDPFFPQQIAPLTFNQTHRGFVTLDYRFGNDDGPEFFGNKLLSNFGANIQFSFTSGFNYTRWEGFGNARIPQEPLNASTTPWTFTLDLKLDKTFDIGPLGFNVYLWVQNLLDTRNVVGVFNTSGDPYTDGWLTEQGEAIANSYNRFEDVNGYDPVQLYKDIYNDMNYNRGHFGDPRQIRLGVRLKY
jgi:outer membrane receptor protein involved in Fe transport